MENYYLSKSSNHFSHLLNPSSTLLVQIPETSSNGLPPEIILKIFDPRYATMSASHMEFILVLWTLEAETAAAQYRQEIAEEKRSDDLTTDIYRDGKDKPYLWEEYFY